MRVTVWFCKPVMRDEAFVKALVEKVKSYPGDAWCAAGLERFGVEHLSWNDAFKLACEILWFTRERGGSLVKEMRVYIDEDGNYSDHESLANRFRKSLTDEDASNDDKNS